MSAIEERERWKAEMQEQQREFRRVIAERDRRDTELRESLELYKGHELTLEGLVRAVFRWGAGEGPKAPSATDREAQVQREAEEFYDEVKP